jgi:hypothetical protein
LKIRLLASISGPAGTFVPGDETDWPDDKDAKRLIDAQARRLAEIEAPSANEESAEN